MVDLLNEMTRYVAGELNTRLSETNWTPGEKVMAGYYPAGSPDEVVTIKDVGGDENFNHRITSIDLQVIARADGRPRAKQIAIACHEAIHGLNNAGRKLTKIGSPGHYIFIQAATANALPTEIGQDEKGRFEFSAEYILQTQEV